MQQVMTDTATRNFKLLVAEGAVVNNPYSSRSVLWSYGGSHGRRATRSAGCSGSLLKIEEHSYLLTAACGYLPWGTSENALYPMLDTSSAEVSTLTAAFADMTMPDVQGLVELAEIHKTLDMLRHPLNSMIKYVKKSKRKSGNHYGDHAAALGGTWLELRYGWFPLMMSVEGTLKALSQKVQDRKTSRSQSLLNGGTVVSSSNFLDAYNDMWYDTSVTTTALVRSGVMYSHDLALLSENLGLSLSDVPSAMWELLPYSFVVDWFLNVSNIIGALTPRAGITTRAAWTSVTHTRTVKRTVTNYALGAGLVGFTLDTSPVGAWDQAVYTDKWRSPKSRADIGLTFTATLSTTHIKDLLALLSQRLR